MKIEEHSNDVNIRVGIIIRKTGTSQILIEHATGKYAPMPCMDIPKGHLTAGEDFEVGACREVFEETGVEIDPGELIAIGSYPYNKTMLHLYYIETNFDITKCKCISTFKSPSGKELPEVDGYELFDMENNDLETSLLYKGLKPILKDVFEKIKQLEKE